MGVYSDLPYDMRNAPQVGKYDGVGQRGKTAKRVGTYSEEKAKVFQKTKGKPPRKMN